MSEMAAALAKHGIWGYNGSEIACECNRRNWMSGTGYAAHQAAALSAAGFGPVQAIHKPRTAHCIHCGMAHHSSYCEPEDT